MRPRTRQRAGLQPQEARRAAQREGLPQDSARSQGRERFLAVLVVGAVDDQNAVQMVELVLDDARAVFVELQTNVFAVRILALEHDPRRTLDRHLDALQRETALLVD